MTHPPRYFQRILACPRDDAPRLLYANWLDGCGNPLGEFIRLQCLLATNLISEPNMFYERREQQLLADNRLNWSRAIAARAEWCSFRRGFVEEVSLTEKQFIQHAAELFQHAPVVDVHLISKGHRLGELPHVPPEDRTLFLDLSAHSIGDFGIERLVTAPLVSQLHGLNLSSCHISDMGLDALIDSFDLDNLRELYLSDNQITDESIRRFVLSPLAEQLDVLDVRHNELSEDALEVLQRVLGDHVLC